MASIYIDGELTNVTSEVETLKRVLVEFIRSTDSDWKINNQYVDLNFHFQWEEKNSCKQAKAIFTTIMFLLDYNVDTYDGDILTKEIFNKSCLALYNVDYNDFYMFMWSDLC